MIRSMVVFFRILPYKKGDENKFENYRPINSLPFISIIFDYLLCNGKMNSFINNNRLRAFQYGYLKGKLTKTAMFHFINDIVN